MTLNQDGIVSKMNLYELFDIFVGITEDKYNNIIEGVDSPAFLLRLSSINEFDNTIRHRKELIENEKKIDLFRSRREIKFRPETEKINIPYKFLLQPSDYIITNRGATRIISIRKALDLEIQVENLVATQQFLYLRPKEVTYKYDYKYLDILIETIANHLKLKEDYTKIKNIVLKEGHKLIFDKFEVGQPVTIENKNGGSEKIENGKHYAYVLDHKKNSKIRFETKDGIIEEITRSLLNILTVKELESIELNITEDLNAQKELINNFEKKYFALMDAKNEFDNLIGEMTIKLISN